VWLHESVLVVSATVVLAIGAGVGTVEATLDDLVEAVLHAAVCITLIIVQRDTLAHVAKPLVVIVELDLVLELWGPDFNRDMSVKGFGDVEGHR